MPIVRVDIWAGENDSLKRKIAAGITGVIVENVKCPPQAVTILFNEISKDKWVIGGEFCSDLFKDNK